MVYCAGKPIESVVYYLCNYFLFFSDVCIFVLVRHLLDFCQRPKRKGGYHFWQVLWENSSPLSICHETNMGKAVFWLMTPSTNNNIVTIQPRRARHDHMHLSNIIHVWESSEHYSRTLLCSIFSFKRKELEQSLQQPRGLAITVRVCKTIRRGQLTMANIKYQYYFLTNLLSLKRCRWFLDQIQ